MAAAVHVPITVGDRVLELIRYRDLVVALTVRDLKLKYKRSALGIAWSFVNPLLMMAIYTAVFSLFLRAVNLPHYWALVLSGVLAWTFFANSMISATSVFVRSPNLITKVYFPLEALPFSMVLAHFVNFLITLAILLVILLVAGIHLGASLILLPVIVVAHLAATLGLGLLAATFTVSFRDIEHFVSIGLSAWFYLTPVIYPLDAQALPAGAARFLPYLKLNPLAWYLESYHSVLYYGTWPDPLLFGLMLASAVAILGGGYVIFARVRPRLPEEL
jgi:ABC-type polysaccharide/polyol phosphate export permease